jgi:hypothetical protein
MPADEAREIEARLAAVPREVHVGAAALLREVRPKLRTQAQRRIADEMAARFDQRAAAVGGAAG